LMLSSDLFAPLRMAVGWVGSTCPLFVMFDHVRGTRFWESPNLGNSVRMIALQAALGAVMTTLAVRRLRPAFRKDESKQQGARASERDEATPENKVSQSTPGRMESQPERSWLHATCDDDATPGTELAPAEPSQTEPQPARFRLRPRCGDDAMLWKEV